MYDLSISDFLFLWCFYPLDTYKHIVCLGLFSMTKSWKTIKPNCPKIIDIQRNKRRNGVGRLHFVDTLRYFVIHSTSDVLSHIPMIWRHSTENDSCKVASFFFQHSVVIPHLVYDRLLSLYLKENVEIGKSIKTIILNNHFIEFISEGNQKTQR